MQQKMSNLTAYVDVSSFDKMIDKLEIEITNAMKSTILEHTKTTQTQAILLAKKKSGLLASAIKVNFTNNGLTGVVSVSRIDVPYLPYVYYGTGKYSLYGGTLTHWYTKASNFPSYADYGFKTVTAQDGTLLVKVYPQMPNPFMEIAFESTKKNLDSIIDKNLNSILGV